MNKKIIILLTFILCFGLGIIAGYYTHDVQNDVSIRIEAQKLLEQWNYKKMNMDYNITSIDCTGVQYGT